jgi:methionine aminotransferase
LDYHKLSDKNDTEFCEHLTKEIGVAAIPLSPFYRDGTEEKLIRICFAKRDEVLRQAAEKLCSI